jgi:hypothetical protein
MRCEKSPQARGQPWRQRTSIGYRLGRWVASGAVGSYRYLHLMRETMYFWLSLCYEAKSVTYLSLMLDIILQCILTHGEAFLQMGGLVGVSLR